MVNKEKILELYFVDKYKQIEIVKLLNVSRSTVNRIVINDERYLEEKNKRQKFNKEKNKLKTKEYITKNRIYKKNIDMYEKLKQQHNQDVFELSRRKSIISNRAYRDWNPSIYEYNRKNKSYDLKKDVVASVDVPKSIKWDL